MGFQVIVKLQQRNVIYNYTQMTFVAKPHPLYSNQTCVHLTWSHMEEVLHTYQFSATNLDVKDSQ